MLFGIDTFVSIIFSYEADVVMKISTDNIGTDLYKYAIECLYVYQIHMYTYLI